MKNYTYHTATGSVTVELDEMWVNLLSKADMDELNTSRKHTRSDHKYALGKPLSLESLRCDGAWFTDYSDCITDIDLSAHLEQALAALTDLQRRYFVMHRIEGYSCAEIARHEGKHKVTISGIVKAAEKKLRSFFG